MWRGRGLDKEHLLNKTKGLKRNERGTQQLIGICWPSEIEWNNSRLALFSARSGTRRVIRVAAQRTSSRIEPTALRIQPLHCIVLYSPLSRARGSKQAERLPAETMETKVAFSSRSGRSESIVSDDIHKRRASLPSFSLAKYYLSRSHDTDHHHHHHHPLLFLLLLLRSLVPFAAHTRHETYKTPLETSV